MVNLFGHPCMFRYSRSGTSTSREIDTPLVLSWMAIPSRRPCTDRSSGEHSVFGLFVRYWLRSAMEMPFRLLCDCLNLWILEHLTEALAAMDKINNTPDTKIRQCPDSIKILTVSVLLHDTSPHLPLPLARRRSVRWRSAASTAPSLR